MHWALILKDIVQHARPLGILFASAFALPPAFSVLSRSDMDGAGYFGIVFGFLALGMPMLFGQWFIGQEKTKGTFRLLCSLPVSGTKIIAAKYLGSMLLSLILINGSLLLEPVVCRLCGLKVPQPAAALVIGTNLIAGLLVSISITLFTLLDVRVASQAIIWSMCLLMVGLSLAAKFLEGSRIEALTRGDLRLIIGPPAMAMAGILLVCLPIAIVWLGATIFEKKEWSQLEEG